MPDINSICKLTCAKRFCLQRKPLKEDAVRRRIKPKAKKQKQRERDRRTFSVDFYQEDYDLLDAFNIWMLSHGGSKKEWLISQMDSALVGGARDATA